MDHEAMEEAITAISNNLSEVTRSVKLIAALMEDGDDDKDGRLIDATRRLFAAFTDLLSAAEPNSKAPRQDLRSAAGKVGEASQYLLYTIDEENEYDRETSDILLSLAKGIASSMAGLVIKARQVATECEDESLLQNKVISAATQCALATSQLVACAKVVVPTIGDPACQLQLTDASKEVAKAVEYVHRVTQEATRDGQLISGFEMAAAAVAHALNDLLSHLRTIARQSQELAVPVEPSIEQTVIVSVDERLAEATLQLLSDDFESNTLPEPQQTLILAARSLSNAMTNFVDAAMS
ncbi:Talin-2 [Halotydeus destructor]|nr:Talin-2 [Halotydeus destructor]